MGNPALIIGRAFCEQKRGQEKKAGWHVFLCRKKRAMRINSRINTLFTIILFVPIEDCHTDGWAGVVVYSVLRSTKHTKVIRNG